jgi:hypothetical protein
MANKATRVAGITFEGVAIPRGTDSAKLAAKGITTVDDMGKFLTAVFSDTLKGMIILPPSKSPNRMSAKLLKGLEQRFSEGLPMAIQLRGSGPRTRRRKAKQTKDQVPKQN